MTRKRETKTDRDQPQNVMELLKSFLIRRIGPTSALILVGLISTATFIWWNRDDIVQKPGVKELIQMFRTYPTTDPSRLVLALSSFENDPPPGELKRLLLDTLTNMRGIQVVDLDEVISRTGDVPEDAIAMAHSKARKNLERVNADIMLWGEVLRQGSQRKARLYWTVKPSIGAGKYRESSSYRILPDEMSLPDFFFNDLANVIQLLLVTYGHALSPIGNHPSVESLESYVSKVENALGQSAFEPPTYNHAIINLLLGGAMQQIAEIHRDSAYMKRTIRVLESSLSYFRNDKLPFNRSGAQNNIAICQTLLNELDPRPQYFNAAEENFLQALEAYGNTRNEGYDRNWSEIAFNYSRLLSAEGERMRDTSLISKSISMLNEATNRLPIGSALWVGMKCGLCNSLRIMANLRPGTEDLHKLLDEQKKALQYASIETMPDQYGNIKNIVGIALMQLAEREDSKTFGQQSITAFQEALQLRTSSRDPKGWVQTMNNLGCAFQTLSTFGESKTRLTESISTFNTAISSYPSNLDSAEYWALHVNLGNSLLELGVTENNWARQVSAVKSYEIALRGIRREKTPYLWATTQIHLGRSLSLLGAGEHKNEHMERSKTALQNALTVFSKEYQPGQWAMARLGLGNALLNISYGTLHTQGVVESIPCFMDALEYYRPRNHPLAKLAHSRLFTAVCEVERWGPSGKHFIAKYRSRIDSLMSNPPSDHKH